MSSGPLAFLVPSMSRLLSITGFKVMWIISTAPEGPLAGWVRTSTCLRNLFISMDFFAFAGDVDGAEMFYGAVGAEGMIALTETTTIEMRAGAGMADQNGLDFVFGGLGVTQDVGDSLRFGVQLEVAEFDEAAFEAIGTELTLSARYSPPGSGLGLFAEVGRHDLSGSSGAPAEVTVRAGLSLELGRAGAKGPRGTRFRSPDPIAQLVRRGLY